MRIINNPNPQEETITTCEKCQCEFAYTSGDVSCYSNGILGPGHHGYRYVHCPNCGQMIIITSKK